MALFEYIGQTTTLMVSRQAAFGYFLTDGQEDVLLHNNEVEEPLEDGQEVQAFLYIDSQGRISATTNIPEIQVGQYGWAKVSDVKPGIGVFINIGVQKDMLLGEEDLPAHRSVWPEVDDTLYITLRVNRNNRIYVKLATDPIIEEISEKADRDSYNNNIHGFIYRTAKVGSWVYTAEGYKGFIHESQRKVEPRLGEKVEGRIIDVKEDGTINVSLIPRKQETLDDDTDVILSYLALRNGAMPYSDKSTPEDIKDRFQLSKASFKRALGRLMKDGRVYQKDGWTYEKEQKEEQE
ncbi:CvfB family protein [Cytobacillus purgationiresistens]|uniref:RNA-binding protein (Virulence factor B family) n=1 Tax=Cytobacillus purgationiresistens TaxID=863449 RepID=A0ABU0ABZ8_9BACI|nr:S1-like domain-containing RNA-binding protein [Cytobacillus purgationiresistens]MDQ0268778.1 putative RNA-binding protein (virulence factor B family) [Cytobacillus purgationiresistens]